MRSSKFETRTHRRYSQFAKFMRLQPASDDNAVMVGCSERFVQNFHIE